MTSSNTPSNSADQDDPWEQLADLVGLEGGKEYVASPPPAAGAARPAPPPAVQAPVERAPVRDNPPDVTFDAEPPAVEFAEEDVEEESDEPETAPSADSPVPAAHTASTTAQDSYWDALANWNWDDSDGGAGKARPEAERPAGGPPPRSGGPRGRDDRREKRGGDRPQRSSAPPAPSSRPPAAASPPPRAARPAVPGDDFGLGVGDEPEEFSSPVAASQDEAGSGAETGEPPTAARDSTRPAMTGSHGSGSHSADRARGGDQGAAAGDAGDGTHKRRRRRRRRGGRGGDREQSGVTPPTSAAAVPGTDWDDSAGPETDFSDEPETPAASSSIERPAEESNRDRPARPPRGRQRDSQRDAQREPRREGRHEGPSRRSAPERSERAEHSEDRFEEEDEPQEISMGGGAAVPDLDDDGDDESGEPLVSYENVPSWEEAISYLLHPNQVQVEPGAAGSSSPPRGAAPPDQPRQTRHIGNRKPPRR